MGCTKEQAVANFMAFQCTIPSSDIVIFSDGSRLVDRRAGGGYIGLQAHYQFLCSSLSYGHGKEVFNAEAEAALAGAQAAIDLSKKSLNLSAPLQLPSHFAKGFLTLKADLSKSDGSLDTPKSLRTKRLISLPKRELPQSLLLLTNSHTPC
ncbi:hypothetical protein TSTA_097390 [Talaromyces stipitatus ATCC 10500]|uniref:RNase H type-1 domain-containing protein n=1 Tax=Talaromyces stipitatus (strain ATCC 10500 / CBS 375.48 / QM 6759 / NRRL 1006) TaxID=441959 RepID=B8MLX1_TALSN|nr:uncharacterized protein TSTA_097390 [Talaromyces stipitatus ATCC 10500]EED13483.1 hypothetical protein TSTA_097390 [Talaromyces stipitatus ATCC 10500]